MVAELRELLIARWSDRFVAWLIDFIVVGAVTELVFILFALPFAFRFPRGFDFADSMGVITGSFQMRSAIFLIYWTYLESTRGQSLGKKLMSLKVVDMHGNTPNTATAFLQALGKAFILPLDILIGLVFFNEKRQRLLNKLSDTIVVKVKPIAEAANVKLIKE